MKNRIAIIGGIGFVGHHLALVLDAEIQIIDSLSINSVMPVWLMEPGPARDLYLKMLDERKILLNGKAEIYNLDARDYHALSHNLSSFKPDTVIHLAAVSHIDRSRKDPHTTFDHSLRTLENALDVSVALGVKRFVYFSSSTVYGDFPPGPIFEEIDCHPKGTYGSLKLAGELMVKAYHHDKRLDYNIVRPQALYGPRCISGRVIQKFIENALQGAPLTVHGDNLSDFTHIDDLVEGMRLLLDGPLNETFNLTAGAGHEALEVAEIVNQRIPCRIIRSNADDGKPKRGAMSVGKAQRLLGYRPRLNLDSGVNQYIDWYKEFWNAPQRKVSREIAGSSKVHAA